MTHVAISIEIKSPTYLPPHIEMPRSLAVLRDLVIPVDGFSSNSLNVATAASPSHACIPSSEFSMSDNESVIHIMTFHSFYFFMRSTSLKVLHYNQSFMVEFQAYRHTSIRDKFVQMRPTVENNATKSKDRHQ